MKRMLVTRHSECVQPLRALVERQTHRVLVRWALDCGGTILELFERRVPGEPRPREAWQAAESWARGRIKMPQAKRAAHAAHNAATQWQDDAAACAAARTMGHVVGTVHVETHALGIASYGVTALVYDTPQRPQDEVMREALEWLYRRLVHWQTREDTLEGPWAPFLLRDGPNKEWLLHQRENEKKTGVV